MTSIATLGIEVKSRGVKEAERDLKALEKQGEATERAATKMGKAWGLAIGGAVVAGVGVAALAFKKYIANSIEAEKVQAQLAQRIKSTGMAAGLAIGDLNKMADALQAATTFDDESIGKAQAVLLTFTKVGKESFGRATEAILDMSTALGKDLQSSALQVGKALNDPVKGVRALGEAGVQFTQSQKDTIKALVETGDVARAQSLILKELETQMGGSARAARDTLGGAIDALKNSFNNLLEGEAGGLRGTKDAVNNLNAQLNDPGLKAGIDSMASGLISIANAAIVATSKLGSVLGAYRAWLAENGRSSGLESDSLQTLIARRDALVKFQNKPGKSLYGDVSDPISKIFGVQSKVSSEIVRTNNLIQVSLKKTGATAADVYKVLGTDLPNFKERGGDFNFAADQAKRFGKPDPVGGKPAKTPRATGGGGRSSAARAMPDFAKDAARELERLAEIEGRATEAFKDLEAQLQGPMAVALRDHEKRVAELNTLAKESPTALAGLNDALKLEAKRHEENVDAIKRQLDPLGELLQSFEFELEMIGKSNAERAVMIELRRANIDVMSKEGQAALIAAKAFESNAASKQQAINLMDSFRDGASDAFTDIVTGAKSAKDALTDFLDSLGRQITQAIADNLFGQLFGPRGSDGSGSKAGGGLMSIFGALTGSSSGGASSSSGGNWFSTLLGSIFGGGRAIGGPTTGGRMYEVNERGAPEMFTAGGRSWMLAGRDGQVTPMTQSGGGGSKVINNAFYLPERYNRQTQFQIDQATGRSARRAITRGGG